MQCAILSSWNYILGPQIEKLWFKSTDSCMNLSKVPDDVLNDFNASKYFKHASGSNNGLYQFDMKTYCMMCGQLLLGVDLCKMKSENSSRFYLTGTNILVSVIFQVKSWLHSGTSKKVEDVNLCFGVVFERDIMDFVLDKHFIIDNHLRKVSSLIKQYETSELPVEKISAVISELMLILDSLTQYNLSNIKLSCQEFWHSPSDIFEKAIVSHLQTSGRTVIVGASEYKINELISALSMFTSYDELQNCLSVAQKPLISGIYGVYIQGSLKKAQEESELLLKNAAKESLPLTVVDTDINKVCQTLPFNHSSKLNNYYDMIEDVGVGIPELLKFLKYGRKFESNKQFIEDFCKLSSRKSMALIKAVEHCRLEETFLSKKDAIEMLNLRSNTDLKIVLGYAQKIKPGIEEFVL